MPWLSASAYYFLRPQRALNLPDVGFSQEEHTDTGLADAAADGVGQLFFNNSLLEGQLRPFRVSLLFKLGKQGSLSTRIPMEDSSSAMSRTG